MVKRVHGTLRGRVIELDEDLGVAEGQAVEVQVMLVVARKKLPCPPPGWRPKSNATAAGMMADSWTDEDDRILDQIHQDRKQSSRRESPE
jgi:hypothetical protein